MKEELKQENCCTPIGQIKRYVDCHGCDRKPKQETVEEVAERFWRNDDSMSDYVQQAYITGFIAGAKWMQERMYSEEKVINAFNEGQALTVRSKLIQGKEWFEQFKNKRK